MRVAIFFFFLLVFFAGNIYGQAQQREVIADFKYAIASTNKTKKAKLVCALPQTIAGRQEVLATSFSLKPDRIFRENGNLYAEFELEPPFKQTEIVVSATLRLHKYDLKAAAGVEAGAANQLTSDSLQFFLQDEKYIEKKSKTITALAARLKGADINHTVKNIYHYVSRELSYGGYNGTDIGAAKALKTKKGDCTEFADLFVALCRANNIAARVVEGYITDWTNTPKHSWVEVYTPAHGWVPFDPTPGNKSGFDSMSNRYIYLSTVRNDKVLNNFHFFSHLSWGEPIQVMGTYEIRDAHQNAEMARAAVL